MPVLTAWKWQQDPTFFSASVGFVRLWPPGPATVTGHSSEHVTLMLERRKLCHTQVTP